MIIENDDLELDKSVFNTLKKNITQLEKNNARDKNYASDELASEIKKRIERLVDGN